MKKATKPYTRFCRIWVGGCCNLVFLNILFSGYDERGYAGVKSTDNASAMLFQGFSLPMPFIYEIRAGLGQFYLQIFTKSYILYRENFYLCSRILGSWGATLYKNMIYFRSTMRVYCLGMIDRFHYIPIQQHSRHDGISPLKNFITIPVNA